MTLSRELIFRLAGVTVAILIPCILAILRGIESNDPYTAQVGESNSFLNSILM